MLKHRLIASYKGEKMRICFYATTIIISLLMSSFSYSMLDEIKKDLHKAKDDIATVIGVVIPSISEYIKGEPRAIINNKYKDKDAFVRQGPGISKGEKKYLIQRTPITKAALEKLTKKDLSNHHIPTIGVAYSGGGIRAMLCATGMRRALKKMGILNAITHEVGLSGSTWMLASCVSSQMSSKDFQAYMIACAQKPFLNPMDEEELLIFEAAAVKAHFKQPRTSVDPYGALMGAKTFHYAKDKMQEVYLSDQANIIKNGESPYPVYVALDANKKIALNQTWYDFTPHEIGNPIDEVYVPTWAYGRKFVEGKSDKDGHTYYPPEKNLPYHEATWGSAFGANWHTIEHEIAKKIGHHDFIEKILKPLEGERPIDCYAQVANYSYKLSDQHTDEYKTFVDAGTDFNLPIPPISGLNTERKAHIMIICDASAGTIGTELEKAAQYMQRHNLPFPKIDLTDIDKTTVRVFKEEDPNVPIVIYFPRISDQELWQAHQDNPKYARYNLSDFNLDHETNNGFAQTIHFDYTQEDAQKVINQMKFNVMVNKKIIIDAIKYGIDRMNVKTQ